MNELTAEYQTNGLTYKSNNESITKRDVAGNIQIDTDTTDILIIEPVIEFITLDSALRVIDTQFNYYSFPLTAVAQPDTDSFEFDDNLNLDTFTANNDIIYAMYQPSGSQLPLPGSANKSGIDMSVVLEGTPQQFTNKYYISDDIKQSGKDLRFRAKLTHKFDGPNNPGTCYWHFNIDGFGGLRRGWKGDFTSQPVYRNTPGFIDSGSSATSYIDIIVLNDEIQSGDKINISVSTGQPGHFIISNSSYWSITDASKNVDIWNNEIQ